MRPKNPQESRKERSFIEGVPLLTYPGTPETFHVYQAAWKAYAERTFPETGRCFANEAYDVVVTPTKANQAEKLALFETAAAKTDAFNDIIKRFLKREEAREDEKKRVHGALLSTMSERSVSIVRTSNPALLASNSNPLGLWMEVKKTHESGLHHLTKDAGRLRLEEEVIACKQRLDEHPEEFATRFKTTMSAYLRALPEAERPPERIQAYRFYLGVSKVRNSRFAAEIAHREVSGMAIPTSVDAMMTLMQSCAAVDATTTAGTESEAIAYSATSHERDRRCFSCGKTGHIKRNCPDRKQGGGPTVAVAGRTDTEKASTSAVEVIEEVTVSVAADDGKTLIMDSGATHHVMSDPSMVTNVRESERTYIVSGFNGAKERTKLVADYGVFGRVIFVPESEKNLLALGKIDKDIKVHYSHDEETFSVKPAGEPTMVFRKTPSGLYAYDWKNVSANFVDNVEDRRLSVGAEQYKRAKAARAAEQVMAFPSPGALAYALSNGAIKDAPFGPKDIAIAEQLFGPSEARMKGKATRARQVANSLPADGLKSTLADQELHCDHFQLCGRWFLMSTMVPLGQVFASETTRKRGAARCKTIINNHIALCRNHGFNVTRVIVDLESPLVALAEKGADAVVVPIAKGQHVQRAERQIRTVKERARAILHSLPYKLPGRCVVHLVSYIVQKYNALPRRSTGPVAPNELFTGRKFNFKVDAKSAFGAMVYSKEPQTDNTMAARARTCLVMSQVTNLSENWYLLDIDKGTFVRRASWEDVPLTSGALERIEALANADKQAGDPESIGDVEHNIETDSDDMPLPKVATTVGGARTGFIPPSATRIPELFDEDREPIGSARQANDRDDEVAAVREVEPTRRSARLAGKHVPVFAVEVEASHIYVKEARRKHGSLADFSAEEEMREILEREVLQPLSPDQARVVRKGHRVVKSFLFFKEKMTKAGELERLKARLVAIDNSEESALHPSKNAPAARLETIMLTLAVAGAEGRRCAALDVGNAYLEAEMGDDEVYVELDPTSAMIAKQLDPSLAQYEDSRGIITAKLKKALYGCVQSARLWYEKLKRVLLDLGFEMNPYDQCVFNKLHDGKQLTVCTYVDDLLATSVLKSNLTWIRDALSKVFKKVKYSDEDDLQFVSLEICQREGQITVRMDKYVQSLIEEWDGTGKDASPARPDLFRSTCDSAAVDDERSGVFRRRVARLLYLAKRVAPELLLAISHLSTKVNDVREVDWDDLERAYRYLNANRGHAIDYWRGSRVSVTSYIDSSHASHSDFKGRTGCVLLCAGGLVGAWSTKQSINTKSSTESELVGLAEDCSWVIWARNWLAGQGYEAPTAIIYQDNLAVQDILKKGPSAELRTRHLSIKYHFVADLVKRKEVIIEYCPTDDMIADALTKPLVGERFGKLRGRLVNVN
jgi:hypothetical protein